MNIGGNEKATKINVTFESTPGYESESSISSKGLDRKTEQSSRKIGPTNVVSGSVHHGPYSVNQQSLVKKLNKITMGADNKYNKIENTPGRKRPNDSTSGGAGDLQDAIAKKEELEQLLQDRIKDEETFAKKVEILGVKPEEADALQEEIRTTESRLGEINQEIEKITEKMEKSQAIPNNNIEILDNGAIKGVIQEGDTLVGVVEKLVIQMLKQEGDLVSIDEVKGLASRALTSLFEKFSNNQQGNVISIKNAWREQLKTISVGDEVIVSLGQQGVELEVPRLLNSTEDTDMQGEVFAKAA